MGTALQKVNPKEAGDVLHLNGVKNSGIEYSPVQALAFEAGIYERTVQNIYRNDLGTDHRSGKKINNVSWKTVDKLLTAMELVHLWYIEPLSEYYTLSDRSQRSLLQSAA